MTLRFGRGVWGKTRFNRCPKYNGSCGRIRGHHGNCHLGSQFVSDYLDSLHRPETRRDFENINRGRYPEGQATMTEHVSYAVRLRDESLDTYLRCLDDCEREWSFATDETTIAPWLNDFFMEPEVDRQSRGLLKARGRVRFSSRGQVRGEVLKWVLSRKVG